MSKSNQTRYGVSHVYLERKTKRIFGIDCLQKKFVFNRKYRLIRLLYAYSILKNIEILSGQGVVQIKKTRHGVSHVYLKRKAKRIFDIACLEKSSYFNRKYRLICLLYAYSILKNIEILLGQGVVQIKKNSAWSIPCVPKA